MLKVNAFRLGNESTMQNTVKSVRENNCLVCGRNEAEGVFKYYQMAYLESHNRLIITTVNCSRA